MTTYVSFPKLVDYLKQTKQVIDMTIFDEAHNCNGEKVSRILNDETDKIFLGKIRYFSALREINRGTLFDYSFSKRFKIESFATLIFNVLLLPKELNTMNTTIYLERLRKLHNLQKPVDTLEWSEAERDTNVLAMVNEFQKCSNGEKVHWIEGVTGKDPRKKERQIKKISRRTYRQLSFETINIVPFVSRRS